MATVIDALVMTIGLDGSKFTEGQKKVSKEAEELKNRMADMGKAVNAAKGYFVQLFAALAGSAALTDLVVQTIQAEAALGRLSKNIGESTQAIQAWGNMAAQAGGSAEEMQAGMANLSKEIINLKYNGESNLLPFFARMGVQIADANGKALDQTQIMLQLADAAQKMPREDFANLAQMNGLNQSQVNVILQGRAALEAQLKAQEANSLTTKKQTEAAAQLNAEWVAMKQEMAALVRQFVHDIGPALSALFRVLHNVVSYLRDHRGLVYAFFIGLAAAMAPAVVSATALVIQFGLLAAPILAVVAAVGLLMDDLLTFADGGESLVPWGKIFDGIHEAGEWVDDLIQKLGGLSEVWAKFKSGDFAGAWSAAQNVMATLLTPSRPAAPAPVPAPAPAAAPAAKPRVQVQPGQDLRNIPMPIATGQWQNLPAAPAAPPSRGQQIARSVLDFIRDPAGALFGGGDSVMPQQTKGWLQILGDAISSGEGDYNSVNRGLVRGRNLGSTRANLSDMTINEVLARNKLQPGDPNRMNAVGRYQIIASTMRELVKRMGLSGEEKLTPEMQDSLFGGVLKFFAPKAYAYAIGQHDDLNAAMTDVAKQWASVGVPVAMRGRSRQVDAGESFYAGDGGNKASTRSTRLVREALEKARQSSTPANMPSAGARTQAAIGRPDMQASNYHSEVHIGQVTVNTAATDAVGIAQGLPAALNNRLSSLSFGLDSGMA